MKFATTKPILIGIAAAALLVAAGYKKIYLPKVTYAWVAPLRGAFVQNVNGVGTLEAKEIIVLAPKTAAKISAVYADEGETVRKGSLLASMELSELSGNKSESIALIEKSKSQALVFKSQIEDLKAKKNLADSTLKRYQSLIKAGFVTQSELDGAQAAADSAAAQLSAAQESLALSEHDIDRSRGSLSALKSKIDDLQLRTPIDGIVVSRDAEEGSTVGGGSAVFHVANPKHIWAKIYIDERQSGVLKKGQKAFVTLRSFPNREWEGKIERIGVQSDRITEERVVFIVLNEVPVPLHLGEQAEARIIVAEVQDALSIPSDTVKSYNGKSGVWVEKENKAHFQPVDIVGENSDGRSAVSGISPNERILVPDERILNEGDKVRL